MHLDCLRPRGRGRTIAAMKHGVMTFAAVVGAFVLAGCGPQVGLLVKPVPVDERLKETVIATDPGWFVTDKIVIVDVDGLLFNRRRQGLLATGENPVSLFVEKIDKLEADQNVRAVVLRINSPGGGVTASDIMHQRLVRLRERRKLPVVAVIQDVGASGAYYVACAAETILAHPTAVVGSVGVMVQTVSFAGTMKMIGIAAKAVTSGAHKDMASPFKPLDKKDLAILQSIVDRYYERFLGVVAAGRKNLKAKEIRRLADGRVYAAEQAAENGLIDRTGYMNDAIELARKRCGTRRAKVVIYHRPWGYRANVYAAAPHAAEIDAPPQINLFNLNAPDLMTLTQPRFLYLWTGKTFGGPVR